MLTKTGAKLLDFGLAFLSTGGALQVADEATSMPTEAAPLTGRGVIVGTLQYMAPEQLEGHAVDARTDLWALGAMLYEAIVGTSRVRGPQPGQPRRRDPGTAARATPVAHAPRAGASHPALPREVPGRPVGHGPRRGRGAAVDRPAGPGGAGARGRDGRTLEAGPGRPRRGRGGCDGRGARRAGTPRAGRAPAGDRALAPGRSARRRAELRERGSDRNPDAGRVAHRARVDAGRTGAASSAAGAT